MTHLWRSMSHNVAVRGCQTDQKWDEVRSTESGSMKTEHDSKERR